MGWTNRLWAWVRSRRALSPTLTTIILFGVILPMTIFAYMFGSNVLEMQAQRMEFDQAKKVTLALNDIVSDVMFKPDAAGYVGFNFRAARPMLLETGEHINITCTDNYGNKTTREVMINKVCILGGRMVGAVAENLAGKEDINLTRPFDPLGRVYVNQSDGAWIFLDYARVRCIYLGVTSYYVSGGYEFYNIVEISLVNMTFGAREGAVRMNLVAQNTGVEVDTRVFNTTTLNISAVGPPVYLSQSFDLKPNMTFPTLIRLVVAHIRISIGGA